MTWDTTRGHTPWSRVRRTKGDPPRYLVFAERDGRFWFLRVEERPELFSQVVRLDQAEALVRDLIATYDGVAPDSFEVRIRPIVDAPTTEAVDALEHLRLLEALGTSLSRALAVDLVRGKGLSMRDAGKVIGLSHQRIAQLIGEHDALGGDARPSVESHLADVEQWSKWREAISVRFDDPPEKRAAAMARLEAKLAAEEQGG